MIRGWAAMGVGGVIGGTDEGIEDGMRIPAGGGDDT